MMNCLTCSTVVIGSSVHLIEKNYVIWLLLSGSVQMRCDEAEFRMKSQDVALLRPGTEVYARPEGSNVLLRVEISVSFLEEAFHTQDFALHCNSVLYPGDYSALVRKLIQLAQYSLRSQSSGNDLQQRACAYQLLNMLLENYCNLYAFNVEGLDGKEDEAVRRERIRTYIQMHYQEPLTLTAMAEYVHLTPQYLSKFFKKQFGVGFLKYLTQLRLSCAYEMLSSSSDSITKVALDNGFPNLSSFNKAFWEKYGVNPREYRHSIAAQPKPLPFTQLSPKESEPYLELEPMEIRPAQTQASSLTASVDVSDDTVVPNYVRNWQQVINLGRAENCLFQGFQEQLKQAVNNLHFRYARMGDIFCENMLSLSDSGELLGLPTFSRIINILRSLNLIPFLDLGAKPTLLELEPASNTIPQKRNYMYSDRQWKDLMGQFLNYCANTWGPDYVSQWLFELWQPQGLQGAEQEPRWAELYTRRLKITMDCVRVLVPGARVGGPGFIAEKQNIPRFEALFQEWTRQKVKADFVTVYLYPAYITHEDANAGDSTRRDIACIVHPCDQNAAARIGEVRQVIERFFVSPPPLYVVEYNCDITSRSYINDTSYVAAFVAKTVIDTLGETEMLGFSNLSDIPYEERRSRRLLFGGNGMITQDGLKKSSFYAYWLMSKLGDHIIARNENYLVCNRLPGRYEILVHNFKGLSEAFCREYFRHFRLPPRYDDTFEDVCPLDFHLELTGMRPGKYRVKSFRIDRSHGDLQYSASKIFADEALDLMQEDLQYLSSICVPKQTLRLMTTEDGRMSINTSLSPNEIQLFAILYHST